MFQNDHRINDSPEVCIFYTRFCPVFKLIFSHTNLYIILFFLCGCFMCAKEKIIIHLVCSCVVILFMLCAIEPLNFIVNGSKLMEKNKIRKNKTEEKFQPNNLKSHT